MGSIMNDYTHCKGAERKREKEETTVFFFVSLHDYAHVCMYECALLSVAVLLITCKI